MLLLREALRLDGDGMGVVARLARVARWVQFAPGTAAWSPAQVADVVILLEGALRLARPGAGERRVEAGEVLGLVESVAGVSMKEQAIALESTTALVLGHPELSETIEDDDALSLELIRSFAAQLWSELAGTPPPEDG
jgi:CRP-like cAMP-binding protein